jgi:hypothetical protein
MSAETIEEDDDMLGQAVTNIAQAVSSAASSH